MPCQIFFTGGGVSHYFGGTGTSFDFANNSLASYPASFTPTSNAICMGSYTSGSINLPTGFTRICIGNGYFASSNSVQFVGQLQVYGFQTTTAVSVPATIPACQVVGGGYQLSGVLTKSPCPPGQYSMGGVLACTSCARGKKIFKSCKYFLRSESLYGRQVHQSVRPNQLFIV